MAEDMAPAVTGSSHLEDLTKWMGAAAALLLVLSTAFDFNYLYALGLAFEDVPTTLADHVRSALVWAPKAAVYLLALGLWEMGMSLVEDGQTEEELIRRSRFPRLIRYFRTSMKFLAATVLLFALVVDMLLNNSNRGLYLFAIIGWGSLAFWVVQHQRLGEIFNSTGKRLFVALPILSIWVGSLGYGEGHTMLERKSPTWIVNLKTESGTASHELLGLRRFTTSAVLVSMDRKVLVVPDDLIITATFVQPSTAHLSRICAWFEYGCNTTELK